MLGANSATAERLARFWEWVVPAVAALLALLLFAAWLFSRIRARFRDLEDRAAEDRQMLRRLRELQAEGGLSNEEYRSIRGRLTERIDDSARQAAKDSKPSERDGEPGGARIGQDGMVRREADTETGGR